MPGKVATLSDEALLTAQATGSVEELTDEIVLTEEDKAALGDVEFKGKATVTRASRVVMYNPHGVYGSTAAIVAANAIKQCIAAGWTAACGDCGKAGCGLSADGKRLDSDPNKCAGKAAVKLGRCPVCRKPVHDLPTGEKRADDEGKDENELELEGFNAITPEMRVRARVTAHMLAFHPSESLSYPALVQAQVAQVPGARQV